MWGAQGLQRPWIWVWIEVPSRAGSLGQGGGPAGHLYRSCSGAPVSGGDQGQVDEGPGIAEALWPQGLAEDARQRGWPVPGGVVLAELRRPADLLSPGARAQAVGTLSGPGEFRSVGSNQPGPGKDEQGQAWTSGA